MMNRTIKAYVLDWVIILTALTLIVSIVDIALGTIDNRYDVNAEAAKALKFTYSSSSPQYGAGTMAPSKGRLYYGWAQTKGNKKCKYTWSYKKANKSSYTTLKKKYSFSKNDKYYGEYKIVKCNGKDKYNFKLKKVAGKKTKSKVRVDLMLL